MIVEPWLAANLSWSLPGLGQFYAGRRLAGFVFLALELTGWTVFFLWLLVPGVPLAAFVVPTFGLLTLWIVSAAHAHRAARGPDYVPEKSPWAAVFLARFIPGLGHFYARRWIRGSLWLSGLGVLYYFQTSRPTFVWRSAYSLAVAVMLVDSFRPLRQQNKAPRSMTQAGLVLLLLISQHYFFAEALRRWVAEMFKIPASSMEPTLLGEVSDRHPVTSCSFAGYHSHAEGDRIIVSKAAYAFSPVRRFDLVVLKFPLNRSKHFVKRVVGLPEEEIVLSRGDVYVRPKGEAEFRLVRKPRELQERLWIRPDGAFDLLSDSALFERLWILVKRGEAPSSLKEGVLHFPVGVPHSFEMNPETMGQQVGDARIAFDVTFEDGKAEAWAQVAGANGTFHVRLSRGGEGVLEVSGTSSNSRSVFTAAPSDPGFTARIQLEVFDGTAAVRIGDREVVQAIFRETFKGPTASGESRSLSISFGGQGVLIRNLGVGRDIHYEGRFQGWRDEIPLAIPEDSFTVLGDNVSNSHDSRGWVKRVFIMKDGRTLVCEDQALNRDMPQPRSGESRPDYWMQEDADGNSQAFNESDLVESRTEPSPFIPRENIVGRVVKIWWPPGRSGPVR